MKQLGNLAVVVAKHKDCMLQIYNDEATVYTGQGNERRSYSTSVWDDEKIKGIIWCLNFGAKQN